MHRLDANTMTFYVWDLSIHGFDIRGGSWTLSLMDTEGCVCMCVRVNSMRLGVQKCNNIDFFLIQINLAPKSTYGRKVSQFLPV